MGWRVQDEAANQQDSPDSDDSEERGKIYDIDGVCQAFYLPQRHSRLARR